LRGEEHVPKKEKRNKFLFLREKGKEKEPTRRSGEPVGGGGYFCHKRSLGPRRGGTGPPSEVKKKRENLLPSHPRMDQGKKRERKDLPSYVGHGKGSQKKKKSIANYSCAGKGKANKVENLIVWKKARSSTSLREGRPFL